MYKKPKKIKLLECPACKGIGFVDWNKCKSCSYMQMGNYIRHRFLYWGYPLTREWLALEKARRLLEKLRAITFSSIGILSAVLAGFLAYQSPIGQFFSGIISFNVLLASLSFEFALPFCVAIFCFTYLWYRSVRMHDYLGEVEHYKYEFEMDEEQEGEDFTISSWQEAKKLPSRKKKNIARAFTREAMTSIGNSYKLADRANHQQVRPIHLFYCLLEFNRIGNIFARLGISSKTLQQKMAPLFDEDEKAKVSTAIEPIISDDVKQALFSAYESAYEEHLEYVSVTELLVAVVRASEPIQEILFDLEIEENKLANAVQWARIRERMHHQYATFRRAASHRSKHGMDKAMTAVATPYLNRFSDDMTILAKYGYMQTCIARGHVEEEIFRVVEGGRQSIILVGEYGVGKKTIIEGLAKKMVEDDVPKRLQDKRLVRLNVSSLLAGTTAAGAVERLQRMMSEISRAGNIILYIHNIHELIGVSAGTEKGSLDVSDTLAQYLSGGNFLTVTDTTPEFYSQLILNSPLSNVFAKIEVEEMDENSAIQVLESKVGALEYKHKIFFSYHALEKAVELSGRFLHEVCLPGSALEVISESASLTRNKKGMNSVVTADEVAQVVAQKTSIPLTTISSNESTKLLQLEQEMHKRVIGQDEAVDSVSNALRRARVEIRATNRPIANFLFLGPTGVGKTELAKTISDVYFGGEERMIRIDMSEYQDTSGISRLIGRPGEQGTGILTEAIRRDPFSLVLLDEIEKADPDILNLFLQVMDDGRLTDSMGKVVDFTSAIIIATSNAGTAWVQEQINAKVAQEVIKEKLMHGQLADYFRPEFLNRFDGVILFRALLKDDIKKIAGLMMARVSADLEKKGIEMKVEEQALDYLSEVGYDIEFGARPMRRAIQERVENKLAEMLLSGSVKRRQTIVIGANCEMKVV
ncbi:MAG: ATP-dependent Clp protease ATP-binding subunit [bacterium]